MVWRCTPAITDLGTIAATPKDHRVSFNSVTNALDLELRARRALTGENAPISLASAKPGDLLDARPLVDVLGIAAQDDCRSVKFKSGVTFTVEHGDQTSLNLINPVTREQREYIWSKQSLIINVFAPVELKACDGRVSTAKFERISLRLTFGEQFGQVKLVPAYARILGRSRRHVVDRVSGKDQDRGGPRRGTHLPAVTTDV